MEIRSVSEIAEKFASVTPTRTADYERGVKTPKRDWAQATSAAEGSFELGVQRAIQNKSFGKGVKQAGTGSWQRGATEKGVARWGPGVSLSKDKYAANFGPFADVIARTKLPPRYPKRDPRNLERVKTVAMALAQAKEQQFKR